MNTRFFHRSVIVRRRVANHISHLIDNDDIVVNERSGIADALYRYFSTKWNTPTSSVERDLEFIRLQRLITEDENRVLTQPISENEVWQAIRSMDGNKAPGPDAFSAMFL